MSLSDHEIRQAVKQGQFQVKPRLPIPNPAGIDLRIDKSITLQPKNHTLAATLETIQLSSQLLGILHLRSSLAREGLFASLALVDPGYHGQLTISLYNAGDRPVNLRQGERFIQLSLIRLSKPATQEYRGRYQHGRGVVTSHRRQKILPAYNGKYYTGSERPTQRSHSIEGHKPHTRPQIQTNDNRITQPRQETIHLPRTLLNGPPA